MKKLITLTVLIVINSIYGWSQDWSPVSSGIWAAYKSYGEVNTLAVYNGALYAGGDFDTAGGILAKNIAVWNGSNWSAVGKGIIPRKPFDLGAVVCMTVYNGKLYVGGDFDSAGGIAAKNIATWDGTSWAPVGAGIAASSSYLTAVCSFTVFNGKLYVGGQFDSAGGKPANNIATWDGSTWSTVGSGINGGVYSVTTYDSMLYAGGNFDSVGKAVYNSIAQWNGVTWSPLGTGIKNPRGSTQVIALCIYNNNLYAGGFFDTAGGIPASMLARWNGTKWDSVIPRPQYLGYGREIDAMVVSNGILYLGGSFDFVDNVSSDNVAYWDGTHWHSIGSGLADTSVYALSFYNNALYAGGLFNFSGVTTTTNIAKWDNPLGVNAIETTANSVNVYPNPGNGVFQLKITNEELGMNTTIEVYNVLGEKVYSQFLIPNSQFLINLSNQPNGVYLYRLLSENGNLMGEGKLIIQK